MVKNISGASNVTEYQLVKFNQANKVEREDILPLYLKYAVQYNVQVDVAYVMCLLYTDFFKNEIVNNNIVGIGTQAGGTKLEEFNSIEECVIAHCEILQKLSSEALIEFPKSNLYRRLESGSCNYSSELYTVFNYEELTKYTIYEYSIFIREINRTRKEKPGWVVSDNFYYYIKVMSSRSKKTIVSLRSELFNKGFKADQLFITCMNGMYTLEAGRHKDPSSSQVMLNNLQMYGYNGIMSFRRK